jgi:hypothetical protein
MTCISLPKAWWQPDMTATSITASPNSNGGAFGLTDLGVALIAGPETAQTTATFSTATRRLTICALNNRLAFFF